MSKRIRRQFTPDFKAAAVALVLARGQPVSRVCRDLDLVESVFRRWAEKAQAGSGAPSRSAPALPLMAEQASENTLPGPVTGITACG
jgi:putative transposase